MEKIDRELLIKEISRRLPYGIKVQVLGWNEEKGEVEVPLKVYSINTDGYLSFEYNHYNVEAIYVEDCRLYLRPMSSMTEEEKIYIDHKWGADIYGNITTYSSYEGGVSEIELADIVGFQDWLNKNMFDYRGLIEKGLAIEVTESNNPYK